MSEQEDEGMGTDKIGSTWPETVTPDSESEEESSERLRADEVVSSDGAPASPRGEASGEAPL